MADESRRQQTTRGRLFASKFISGFLCFGSNIIFPAFDSHTPVNFLAHFREEDNLKIVILFYFLITIFFFQLN